ncbi:MAG: hypothetical protein JXA13_15300 [Anaerolineales bacterium]|nr:hypothetical protein [Anaerolineales bacterium]
MDDAALGGELISAYVDLHGTVPLLVQQGYLLPTWAKGPETRVLAIGKGKESQGAAATVLKRNCRLLVISPAGRLATFATKGYLPLWEFDLSDRLHNEVCVSFAYILAVLTRLGLILNPEQEVLEAIAKMQQQKHTLQVNSPLLRNLVILLAGQMMDSWTTFFGAVQLLPVARRWKTQINKPARSPANFEEIPSHLTVLPQV